MSQVVNPTQPQSSTPNDQGGLDIQGNSGIDRLNGSSAGDRLNLDGGDDVVDAAEGDDTVFGGDGNDSLVGRQGKDSIDGGAGDDTIYAGHDIRFGNSLTPAISGEYDNIDDDNDTVIGGEGNDQLYGGAGRDLQFGGKGADLVSGDGGDDTLYGGQGDDTVLGGTGDDQISGNKGNDSLFGGEGSDTFFFAGSDVAALGLDTLVDFSVVEKDKIGLDKELFFDSGERRNIRADEFASVPPTDPATTEAKIIYDATTGLLYYNADSLSGNETPFAQLPAGLDPTDVFNSLEMF